MTKNFGQEADDEMFSVNNGLLMSTLAENRMDKGLFVIVPYANDKFETDIREWNLCPPNGTRYELWTRSVKKCSRWFQPQIHQPTRRSWMDMSSTFAATTGLDPRYLD